MLTFAEGNIFFFVPSELQGRRRLLNGVISSPLMLLKQSGFYWLTHAKRQT